MALSLHDLNFVLVAGKVVTGFLKVFHKHNPDEENILRREIQLQLGLL